MPHLASDTSSGFSLRTAEHDLVGATTATLRSNRDLLYRPDIDGLRAVAVLLVLAYHFQLPYVSGGYIGVDMFFVVSGYLITTLLSGKSGVVAPLIEFYNRRVKRLAPMFLVCAAVTTCIATWLFLPDDFVRYIESLRDALLFKANVYFDRVSKDYFAPSSRELPLLHTWSLAIEWQFYFLFAPIFLMLQDRLSRRYVDAIVVAATLGFSVCSIAVASSSNDHYFSTSARIFELLMGASTARLGAMASRAGPNWLVLVTVALVSSLALVYTPLTPYPGLHALPVCLGVVLLILIGRGHPILGHRWLVHVGKISYSAYLLHWPLIAFLAYIQVALHMTAALLCIGLVLLVSHWTHRFIEEPARQMRMSSGWTFFLFLLLPPLCVLLALVPIRRQDGLPGRLGEEARHAYGHIQSYKKLLQRDCHDFKGGNIETCTFGDTQSTVTALLMGDSHARHYVPFIDVLARQAHIKVYALTGSECLMLPQSASPRDWQSCQERTRSNYELIRSMRFRFVLIGERWIGYPVAQVQNLGQAMDVIRAAGAIPVILEPVAEDGTDKKSCFDRHIKLRRAQDGDCSMDQGNAFALGSKQAVAALFARIREQYPMARFIDPQSVQCLDGRCMSVFDDTPLYDDTHHLNGYGSALLGKLYLEKWGNPLGH